MTIEKEAVVFTSPINNLDEERYPDVVAALSHVLYCFVPMLREVLRAKLKKNLQVICKAANYVLQPGQSYEGTLTVNGRGLARRGHAP